MNFIKEYQDLLDFGMEMNKQEGTYEGFNFSFDYKIINNHVYITKPLNEDLDCPFTNLEIEILESSLNGIEDDDSESLEDFENRTFYSI